MMDLRYDRVVPSRAEVLISTDRTPERAWGDWLAARLEPKGLTVHRASTRQDVLDLVRKRSLSLALLDGPRSAPTELGLLRRIRRIDSSLPCVLVANRVDSGYLDRALALSAVSVLTTPVDKEVLRELIAAVFRKFYESELML